MNIATDFTATASRTTSRRWNFLIVAFAAIIFAPHVFGFFKVTPPGLSENRPLADWPKHPKSLTQIREATRGLEGYIQDHFPPRAHLISILNYLRYRLGYSTLRRVVVGQDGWLFYDGGNNINHYLGNQKLHPIEVNAWVNGFKQRADWLEKRNSKFYMLVAPQKPSVYPDKLPKWINSGRSTEVDEVLSAARSQGIDQIVYPRSSLVTHKSVYPVYSPFDTHWNGIGAYVAYRDLMNRIATDSPEMRPLPLSSFVPSEPKGWQVPRDLALMLGIADHIDQPWVTYVTWPQHDEARTIFLQSKRKDWTAPQIMETDAENERTLLLIRDSFATDLIPFLKPHFRRIISVHIGDGFFRQDLVNQFKPDTVILEILETGIRHTMSPWPN